MTNLGKALIEYAAIVEGIATEYGGTATPEQIKHDHPELNFMDTDEIVTMIRQANRLHE